MQNVTVGVLEAIRKPLKACTNPGQYYFTNSELTLHEEYVIQDNFVWLWILINGVKLADSCNLLKEKKNFFYQMKYYNC